MLVRQRVSLYVLAAVLVFLVVAQATAQQDSGSDRLITLSLQDTPVRTAVDMIFREAGLNYAFEGSISGTVNANLQDVPFDQALQVILRSAGLTMRRENNTYMIGVKKEVQTVAETAPDLVVDDTEIARDTSLEKIRVNYADVLELGSIFGAEYRGSGSYGGGGYGGGGYGGMMGGMTGGYGMGGMTGGYGMGGMMGGYGMGGMMGGYGGSSYGGGYGGSSYGGGYGGSSYGGYSGGYGGGYGGYGGSTGRRW